MFNRIIILVFMLLALAACQTGGADTDGALNSVAGTGTEENAVAPDDAEQATEGGDVEVTSAENVDEDNTFEEPVKAPESPKPQPKPEPKPTPPAAGGDAIEQGMAEIAAIRKSKGERGAVEAIFACYEKARARSASLDQARICAAQDFAVSREIIAARPENATGTGDRALLVSKRHASRIGALLQFKGMSQSQFNTFGRYLHAVAEPAYKKARSA